MKPFEMTRQFFSRVPFRRLRVSDLLPFLAKRKNESQIIALAIKIDHYLEVCRKRGENPQKTSSGKLTLRIPAEVHADIAAAAAHSGKSISKWVAETLKEIVVAQ